ncbi:hypothetical protein BU14_3006s0001, partial [Porphyra umbilicalis]
DLDEAAPPRGCVDQLQRRHANPPGNEHNHLVAAARHIHRRPPVGPLHPHAGAEAVGARGRRGGGGERPRPPPQWPHVDGDGVVGGRGGEGKRVHAEPRHGRDVEEHPLAAPEAERLAARKRNAHDARGEGGEDGFGGGGAVAEERLVGGAEEHPIDDDEREAARDGARAVEGAGHARRGGQQDVAAEPRRKPPGAQGDDRRERRRAHTHEEHKARRVEAVVGHGGAPPPADVAHVDAHVDEAQRQRDADHDRVPAEGALVGHPKQYRRRVEVPRSERVHKQHGNGRDRAAPGAVVLDGHRRAGGGGGERGADERLPGGHAERHDRRQRPVA